MKTTITINGLPVEMAEEAPNKIGPYWWCHQIGLVVGVREIFNPCGEVLIDRTTDLQPKDVGGWWSTSPLIPSDRLTKARDILSKIIWSHFYQSSCRGGEMERLMNQAIEILGGKQ